MIVIGGYVFARAGIASVNRRPSIARLTVNRRRCISLCGLACLLAAHSDAAQSQKRRPKGRPCGFERCARLGARWTII